MGGADDGRAAFSISPSATRRIRRLLWRVADEVWPYVVALPVACLGEVADRALARLRQRQRSR